MADFNEDVVINIEISYAEAIKGITELQTANEKLQSDLINLKKEVDNNSVSQGEYAKSAAATKVAIQQNNDTIRLYQKEIKNNIKAEQQQGESLNALRARLSALNQQYSNMDAVQREAAKGTGGLQGQIIEITKQLKSEEEAMGQFYRNVGNYNMVALDAKKNLKEMTRELQGMAAAGISLLIGKPKKATNTPCNAIQNFRLVRPILQFSRQHYKTQFLLLSVLKKIGFQRV
ncbi:MAG: hypothetical protein FWD66_11655 [Paludibacter sp.]|nr:hypothetical protein [Paludibacter sp.]